MSMEENVPADLIARPADLYAAAANSFQIHLDGLEQQGRKDTPEWHLATGLLLLAQGLQRDREAQDDRVKSFARSSHASEAANSPVTGEE